MALNLYVGKPQHENFAQMQTLFPTHSMGAAPNSFQFSQGAAIELPDSFFFAGQSTSTQEFLSATDTSALLVLATHRCATLA